MLSHTALSSGDVARSTVRVYNDFKLPLDPATLTTMSEYNLSLCLFRTLFELNDASLPTTRILESWIYLPEESAYVFKIKKGISWSDGIPLSARDISYSIMRLRKASPGNYASVANLLRGELVKGVNGESHSGLTVVDDQTLNVRVHSAGPALFNRLSAAFIPLVRSDLVDEKTGLVSSHKVSLGPYVVNELETNTQQLTLDTNEHYYDHSSSTPSRIHMRPYSEGQPDLSTLGSSRSWANLALDRVFIPTIQWEKLKESGCSLWTRPIDRVLFLAPTRAGMKRADSAGLVKWLGSMLEKNPLDFKGYVAIQSAKSLQPPGFILHKNISYEEIAKPSWIAGKKIKIAVFNKQTPTSVIVDHFKMQGVDVEAKSFSIAESESVMASEEFDLTIRSFGAADPDPVTWLTLVFESHFPLVDDFKGILKNKFAKIKALKDVPAQNAQLVQLLHEAGAAGYYLPLAHFSSVAVAGPGFSLAGIRQTDETVDLSKVRIVNAP